MTQRPVLHQRYLPAHAGDHAGSARRAGDAALGDGARPGRGAGRGARRRRRRPGSTAPTCMQRQGHYPPPPGASEIIGLECLGARSPRSARASRAGRSATQVCALLAGGGYAERVAVPAPQLLPVPDGVDLVTAAGLPEVACTVWSNVVMTAPAGGGRDVPRAGRHRRHRHARDPGGEGARGAGRGHRRRRRTGWTRCRELGADIAIDYHDDVPAELKKAPTGTAPTSSSTTWAPRASPPTSTRWPPTAGWSIIGMQGGTKAELNIGKLLAKRGSVIATSLRGRPVERARARSSRRCASTCGR